MKRAKTVILILIVVVSAVLLSYMGSDNDGPPFVASNTGESGTSLLFDTLRRMQLPVRVGRSPLTVRSDTSEAHIIIQPVSPPVDMDMAEEMLDWVSRGGRMIILNNSLMSLEFLMTTPGRPMGNFVLYQIGAGEAVIGRANEVININLMNYPGNGQVLYEILSRWNAERIIFNEYYRGFHAGDNFFAGLPLVVRLAVIQMIIAAIATVWHYGKRFGKPVPYYEEEERDENEFIRALARLYMKGRK